MGVRGVGPYRPRFLAATDFLGCFTHGNGENACCFGGTAADDGNAGVDGERDTREDEDREERDGVEGEGLL